MQFIPKIGTKQARGKTMKLEMLIARAKYYEKSQKIMAKKLDIQESRFSDWKKGRTKPSPFEIYRMAEMARVEPEKAFYDVMSEVDKDNADYWCARRESNPRPSASEVVVLQLLFTFLYKVVSQLKPKHLHIAHNQDGRISLSNQYHHAPANL